MAMGKLRMPLEGGVDVFSDPTNLPDGRWQRLQNLAPKAQGMVGTRSGLAYTRSLQWFEEAPNGQHWDALDPIPYFQMFKDIYPLKFMFSPYGDVAVVAVTSAERQVYDYSQVATGVTRTVPANTMVFAHFPNLERSVFDCIVLGDVADTSLFQFTGILYVIGGERQGGRIEPDSTGDGWKYIANDFGSSNANFLPKGAATVRDRVVYFDRTNTYWSDKNDPLTIGTDILGSRGLNITGDSLRPITAIAELSTSATGSPTDSVAAVFTRDNVWFLTGEPIESDQDVTADTNGAFGSLQATKLAMNAGCISQATITRTPYGTFWVGADDVWFLPFGALPVRVGTNIRTVLQNQPAGLEWRISAVYDENMYKVSVFAPNQGPLVESPLHHQWWLDLSGQVPTNPETARWFGPQVINTADSPTWSPGLGRTTREEHGVWCMAQDDRDGHTQKAYALQAFLLKNIVDETEPEHDVYGWSLCNFTPTSTLDVCAPTTDTGIWQASTAIGVGDVYVPPPDGQDMAQFRLVCVTAGTTDTVEPDWRLVIESGLTGGLIDGTVGWMAEYFSDAAGNRGVLSSFFPKVALAGTTIAWSMLSKEHTLDDEMVEKLMDGAEMSCWLPYPTQLTYNSHPNQDENSHRLDPYRLASAYFALNNVADSWTGSRVMQAYLLPPAPDKRFNANTAVWECSQDSGIEVPTSSDANIYQVRFNWNGVDYVSSVDGHYTDVEQFCENVRQAISSTIAIALGLNQAQEDALIETNWQQAGAVQSAVVAWRTGDVADELTLDLSSKPLQLLGWAPDQFGGFPVVGSTYTYAKNSPQWEQAAPMQIKSINLRIRNFGRRPT